jgi:hypothetical protein
VSMLIIFLEVQVNKDELAILESVVKSIKLITKKLDNINQRLSQLEHQIFQGNLSAQSWDQWDMI